MFYAVKVVYEIFDRVNATGKNFHKSVQVYLIREFTYFVIFLLKGIQDKNSVA